MNRNLIAVTVLICATTVARAQNETYGIYGQGTDSCADFTLMHRLGRDAAYRHLADQYFAMLDKTYGGKPGWGKRTDLTSASKVQATITDSQPELCKPNGVGRQLGICSPHSAMDDIAVTCRSAYAGSFVRAVQAVWMEVSAGTGRVVR